MSEKFNFEEALKALQSGQAITGKNGVLAPLIKQLTEAALEGEIDSHIANDVVPNRRNGKSKKTVKSTSGKFELETPVSTATISAVTDKIIDEVKQWQQRPLESHYPFVWLDAIHYKIKEDGRYKNKAVYTILALNLEGQKEILGLYLSETEGANFWLSVLTDLQHRGVEDILIASVDGLTGFPEAIKTIFPKTEVQLCIVHQIRNSMRYVGSKNHKEFMADLKPVYRAATLGEAETALDALEAKWGEQYPIVIKSWRGKWDLLSAYFRYPAPIRKIMYTTNAVEAVHRQFRKLTKTKGGFPNDNSLLKLLYMGIQNASKKWTMPVQNWNQALSQLAIFFEGRLDAVLDL